MAADEETQRQLAELRERLAATQRIREAHQRRLYVLQEQAAHFGADAPAHLLTESADLGVKIRAADGEIHEIERRIARLELAPQSALVLPESGPPIPQLVPAVVDTRLQAVEQAIEWMRSTIADIREDVQLAREESREWRQAERAGRQEGQRIYRLLFIGGAITFLILAIGVVLIAIRVY